ncbi:MAG: Fe(2+)-trafficking protein, partial [Pseudoxanthomonas sp.]|nr:Fe(2+)-trafficking protein [Pseudoxanthomonas sp.]
RAQPGEVAEAGQVQVAPRDPKHRAFLQAEMEKFLFGGGAQKPAGYVPPQG